MKILKSLSRKVLTTILFVFILEVVVNSEEQPVDIWNIEKKEKEADKDLIKIDKDLTKDKEQLQTITETSIYDLQSQKNDNSILLDKTIESKEIKIIGLYDPENYGLNINMWANSNGDQLKNLFLELLLKLRD